MFNKRKKLEIVVHNVNSSRVFYFKLGPDLMLKAGELSVVRNFG